MASHRELNDLIRLFLDRSLPRSEWTHEAHLSVGLWHIREYGTAEAMKRLRTAISQLNESYGNANTSTAGYHETITRAYVELLTQFIRRYPDDCSPDRILDDLLASPLALRDALLAFYSRDYLYSSAARLAWAQPDVAPLDLAHLLSVTPTPPSESRFP